MAESFRSGSHWIFLVVLLCWMMGAACEAADKVSGILTVEDVLTLPNQAVRIEAKLAGKNLAGSPAMRGVPLQLHIDDKPVATAKTTEAGLAFFEYTPKMRGTNVIAVSINDSPSVEAEKADATLFVWERRRPILVVELAALIQPNVSSSSGSASSAAAPSVQPVPDAAEELTRLTQYYYNLVYVPGGDQSQMDLLHSGGVRRWLESHKFPVGLVPMPATGGLSAILDTFKQEGWTTIKTGIGRTRMFADTLLQHRMEVLIVPEPPKGELPRKAKAAKDWKEVRKKL
jgi:hypothetical protein